MSSKRSTRRLTSEQRDDVLQELLVAAPHGGEAMIRVLEAYLVELTRREWLDGLEEEAAD